MADAPARPGVDGVGLALLTSRFDGIVGAMVNTLVRTGRSGVLNTGRDFSCCILTRDDELLNIGTSLPVHVMCGPDMMARSMRELHPRLSPGDAFLHNSPYHGNSHAADHSILVPVMDDEGRHRFTVFAKAHQADCGNAQPTTYAATARDVYEEGALIFPCVRIQRDYEDVQDIVRMCRTRIRVPDQWWGDYLALLGAVRVGERRIGELAAEIGWDDLDGYVDRWLDYSEHRMDQAIRALPEGTVSATTAHDPFPGVPDGVPLSVTVAVSPQDGVIDVDLTDNPDCVPCGLNLTEATSRTAAIIGVLNSLDHTVPANAGSLRRLRTHLRENCAVGIPRHPTSCSVATSNLMDRVANTVQRAFAQFGDGYGLADAGLPVPPAFAVISGRDPRRHDEPFVNQLVLPSVTGGPAAPHADGWLTFCSAGSAGLMLRDSVELDELRFPLRIDEQRLLPDTGGAGRTRGAVAARCVYGPVGTDLTLMYNCDGTVNPARGVRGGRPGTRADQYVEDGGGGRTDLDACAEAVLRPGEMVVSVSCGGGGYGSPYVRDAARVVHDVAEGLVSPDRARSDYGVVVDGQGRLDAAATEAARAAHATDQEPPS